MAERKMVQSMKTFRRFFYNCLLESSLDNMATAGAIDSQFSDSLLKYYTDNKPNISNVVFSAKDGSKYTIKDFVQMVNSNSSDRPYTITISPTGICKLRTPYNLRIAEWKAESQFNMGRGNKLPVNTMKILAIYELLEKTNGKIIKKDTTAAGIEYEESQVLALNDAIKSLNPQIGFLNLIDQNGKQTGIKFDKAVMIDGNPKADFALSKDGKEVYWISYKEGDYFKQDKETGEMVISQKVPFQQYGEFKKLYKKETKIDDNSIIPLAVNKFCSGIANILANNYNIPSFEGSTKELIQFLGVKENGNKLEKLGVNIDKWKRGSIRESNITKFHFVPSAFYCFHDFYEANPSSPLSLFALKGIYGNDYEPGAEFGINNVNILLQTTVDQISLKEILNYGDHLGYMIDPGQRGHILKNPDLPQSSLYVPVLFGRYTADQYFAFINTETGKKEAILNTRLFVFPKGRVPKNSVSIDIEL